MRVLSHLFTNNRTWAAEMTRQDPEFFACLSRQQTPQYLATEAQRHHCLCELNVIEAVL
jgi:hypothetical protein